MRLFILSTSVFAWVVLAGMPAGAQAATNLGDAGSTVSSSSDAGTTGGKGKVVSGALNDLLGGSSSTESGTSFNKAYTPVLPGSGAGENAENGTAKGGKKIRYRNIYGRSKGIFGDMPMPQRVFDNIR